MEKLNTVAKPLGACAIEVLVEVEWEVTVELGEVAGVVLRARVRQVVCGVVVELDKRREPHVMGRGVAAVWAVGVVVWDVARWSRLEDCRRVWWLEWKRSCGSEVKMLVVV